MNKEKYNQIIGEAYEDFFNKTRGLDLHLEINKDIVVVEGPVYNAIPKLLSKEQFINKCKTNPEFSRVWGVKIEEKELSTQERNAWFQIHLNGNNPFMKSDWKNFELDQQNIPTKLITITYKDKTIESYE